MIEVIVIVEGSMDAITATNLAERVLVEFDPCEEAHRLRDDPGEDRNPKLVVKKLTGGDIIREQQCWEETELEILRSRGSNTGLKDYLKEVEQRLISILDRSDL